MNFEVFQNFSYFLNMLRTCNMCSALLIQSQNLMFPLLEFSNCFTNYAIFLKLCDRIQFEVKFAKLHHRVISEALYNVRQCRYLCRYSECLKAVKKSKTDKKETFQFTNFTYKCIGYNPHVYSGANVAVFQCFLRLRINLRF